MELKIIQKLNRVHLKTDSGSLDRIKKELTVRDPRAHIVKSDRWDGNHRFYLNLRSGGISIALGHLERALSIAKKEGFRYTLPLSLSTDPIPYDPECLVKGEKLDRLQEEGVKALLSVPYGAVELSVGSGKSYLLAALASCYWRHCMRPVIIVVPKRQLLYQLYEDVSRLLPDIKVGLIGDSKREYGDVVVAVADTLGEAHNRDPQLEEFMQSVGAIAGDEGHHITSTRWKTIYANCATADRKWAVSGKITFVSDKLSELKIEKHLGKPLISARNEKRLCPVEFRFYDLVSKKWKKNNLRGDYFDGMPVYDLESKEKFTYWECGPEGKGTYDESLKKITGRKFLYGNAPGLTEIMQERNHWCVSLVQILVAQGKKVAITTSRTIHLILLAKMIRKTGLPLLVVNGSKSGTKQQEIFSQMESEEGWVLLSNCACMKEGTNIPSLTDLIRMDASVGENTLEQLKGRIERNSEGKSGGIMHIPGDMHNRTMRGRVLKMKKYYRACKGSVVSV